MQMCGCGPSSRRRKSFWKLREMKNPAKVMRNLEFFFFWFVWLKKICKLIGTYTRREIFYQVIKHCSKCLPLMQCMNVSIGGDGKEGGRGINILLLACFTTIFNV